MRPIIGIALLVLSLLPIGTLGAEDYRYTVYGPDFPICANGDYQPFHPVGNLVYEDTPPELRFHYVFKHDDLFMSNPMAQGPGYCFGPTLNLPHGANIIALTASVTYSDSCPCPRGFHLDR